MTLIDKDELISKLSKELEIFEKAAKDPSNANNEVLHCVIKTYSDVIAEIIMMPAVHPEN